MLSHLVAGDTKAKVALRKHDILYAVQSCTTSDESKVAESAYALAMDIKGVVEKKAGGTKKTEASGSTSAAVDPSMVRLAKALNQDLNKDYKVHARGAKRKQKPALGFAKLADDYREMQDAKTRASKKEAMLEAEKEEGKEGDEEENEEEEDEEEEESVPWRNTVLHGDSKVL